MQGYNRNNDTHGAVVQLLDAVADEIQLRGGPIDTVAGVQLALRVVTTEEESPDHTAETRWWAYVQNVAGRDVPNREIADRVGIDKANVSRWKGGARPDVYFAIKFARAYCRPVIEALVEGDYITEEEANLREVPVRTADLTTVALAEELLARVKRGA